MLVSLGTHFMLSAYEAAENLQKDRHMTPTIFYFKTPHTNMKYERMNVHCIGLYMRKQFFSMIHTSKA